MMETTALALAVAAAEVFGLEVPDTRLGFLVALGCHIAAGLTATIAGATAMLARKGRGRHPKAGRVYLWALGVVFTTAVTMVVLRWPYNLHLLVLSVLAFGAGLGGYVARRSRRFRQRRPCWARWHILGMAGSYVVMLTAFYVDNGPRLPVWNLLPDWSFWMLPSAIGAPLILRALVRYRALGPSVTPAGHRSRHSDEPRPSRPPAGSG